MRFLLACASLALCGTLNAQVTVLNGASFRTDQPVSAGSWVTAFGNFQGVQTLQTAEFPLPKSLGGVSISVDGTEAPIYFVSGTQLNFLIPNAIQPGVRPVQVKSSAGTVNGTLRVMTAGPGLFLKDTQQPPKGAIRNQDASENTSSNPAKRGDVISIYGTGPGALSQTLPDGAPVQQSPLVQTKSTPQVFIGGVEAKVQFSGMAPGLVGVWQVNAFVPAQSFVVGRVPVRVFIDGVDSNEVGAFVAN